MKFLYPFIIFSIFTTIAQSQYWLKVDSVFSPFGVTVQSFSSPDFCDIDGDGDLDLFVGTLSDERVAFFRNKGNAQSPVFRRDTNLLASIYANGYQFTNADYPALTDLDNDHDADLVIGGFNGVLMYWNIGDSLHPIWKQDTVLMKTVNTMIGTDAKPSFADLDDDGDKDLIIGIGESYYGDVTPGITIAFRNNGTSSIPAFIADNSLITGIPDVGLNAYPYFKDMDSDGDFDLMMGRDLQTMLYYKNTGTVQTPVWTSTSALITPLETTRYWKNPSVCDLDGDGDNDLIYGTDDGSMFYYQNTGTVTTPTLTRNTSYFQMIRIEGGASTTSLADFDNDGDLDLMSGEQLGKFQYFRNEGSSTNPVFKKTTTTFTSLDAGSYSSPRFVDIDADGDIDIVSGALDGKLYTYINTNGAFALNASMFSGVDVGWQSAPSFADLNNDGKVDMIVSGEDGDSTKFYLNTGSNNFILDQSLINGIVTPSYAFPCLADVDSDGDIDLVFGKISGSITFYENSGTPTFPEWEKNDVLFSNVKVPQSSTPSFADLDGDGRKDLIIGEYSGNFSFYKNMLPTFIEQLELKTPSGFSLEQNYPNPFNPVTTIRFSIEQTGFVSLKIYDAIGKEIASLINYSMNRGNHAIQWNAARLPSGLYFYRLQNGSSILTRKMVLIK
jgi:large repetitive protein